MSEWFCQLCNRECRTKDAYDAHVSEFHVRCGEPGCDWSGPETSLDAHRLKHVKAADGKSVTDSPAELRAWQAARKRNFPCEATEKRKAEEQQRRQQSGALEESRPEVSMLEKLLRSAHGLKGKGKGKFGKGKDKGKSKFGKGKDKGKGKGKNKGKGKAKGKQLWSWGPWNGDDWEDSGLHVVGTESQEHATKSLPLPSVVANCVPFEAPFCAATLEQQQPARKRRLCKYFTQGFCFHGENCQYEHEGQPGLLAIGDSQAPPNPARWWTMPSTLANRVCALGEGPAAYHGVERHTRAPRYEAPAPPEDRPRREGLFRRLLQADVDRYYSSILQCVRYIVATDFFRLEKVPLPPTAQSSSSVTPTASLSAELRKDLEEASRAVIGAGAGAFSGVPRVELEEEDLLELAKVLEV